MGLFNHCSADNSSVLEHILKVNKIAVVHMLSKIVTVVEVDNACLVSLNNILGKQNSLCYILRYFARHVVTLNAVYRGVFV